MRTLLSSLVAVSTLLLAGCDPCQRMANAEAGYTSRGKACNAGDSTWSDAKAQTCQKNLTKCSADDQKGMDAYSDCLNAIQACNDGSGMSYGIAKVECYGKLNVSFTCLTSAL